MTSDHPSTGSHERVLLVTMPFGAIERPSLALGLLAAHCQRLGVQCDQRFLNLDFARCIGLDDYLWLTDTVPYTAFAGDWVFRAALHGDDPEADAAYEREVLRQTWHLADTDVERLHRIRTWAGHFVGTMASQVRWGDYTLIGFTSIFQQNIASLALARRVKLAHPHVEVIFGGANWEGEMGQALLETFPFVDLSVSGKADVSFPALLDARRHGIAPGTAAIPGLLHRDANGRVTGSDHSPVITDLDTLPLPDFGPYFDDVASTPTTAVLPPTLLVETARGCWWGERNHCTFCGLNGATMAFRSKSPERAVDEIRTLLLRHPAPFVSVVDDILDMRYFRNVLPALAEEPVDSRFFWEVKANLTHNQLRLLAAAGVTVIQPGVESLSDGVLELMNKGVTGLRNIQLLKWCRELGIEPRWNLLYGFPGEDPADYDLTAQLIEAIWHLEPPTGCGPIRLDRFSPYHDDPARYGMIDVEPMAPFRWLYPVPAEVLRRIAYYFEFGYADGRDPERYVAALCQQVRQWQEDPDRGSLTVADTGERLVIVDQRGSSLRTARLEGWKAAVYRAADSVRSSAELAGLDAVGEAGVAEPEVIAFLERCRHHALMVHQNGHWLATAVHRPARRSGAERPRRLLTVTSS